MGHSLVCLEDRENSVPHTTAYFPHDKLLWFINIHRNRHLTGQFTFITGFPGAKNCLLPLEVSTGYLCIAFTSSVEVSKQLWELCKEPVSVFEELVLMLRVKFVPIFVGIFCVLSYVKSNGTTIIYVHMSSVKN